MKGCKTQNNFKIRVFFLHLLAFFAACLLCSCSKGTEEHNKKGHDNTGIKAKVTYRLKWLFNASTAGDLWAKEKGVFKKYGLRVHLKEGGAEHDAIEEIELKRAQFGVASADQVLRAVSRGADCLVIAQIFQINPLSWIYIKERVRLDSSRLADCLKHLTIGITYGGNDEAIFMALVKGLGLDPEKLHIYAITYDYTPFWKGEVDLWPCYRNTQGITLSKKIERQGQEVGFLDPSRYGIRFVANSLITSRAFWNGHRDIVENFKKAVLLSWQEALRPENLDATSMILSRYEKGLDLETIKEQVKATKRLVTENGKRPIGYIDKAAWKQTEKIMFENGLLKRYVDINRLFQ